MSHELMTDDESLKVRRNEPEIFRSGLPQSVANDTLTPQLMSSILTIFFRVGFPVKLHLTGRPLSSFGTHVE